MQIVSIVVLGWLLLATNLLVAQAPSDLKPSYALSIGGTTTVVEKLEASYKPQSGAGGAYSIYISLTGTQPKTYKLLFSATVPTYGDTGTFYLPCKAQIPFESDSLFAKLQYYTDLEGEESWNSRYATHWSTHTCPPALKPVGFNTLCLELTQEAMLVGANGIAVKENVYRFYGQVAFWSATAQQFVVADIDFRNLTF